MSRSFRNHPIRALIPGVLLAALCAPAAATAGTSVSTVPNLPSGALAGGTVIVGQTGLPGQLAITQSFNGSDAGATALLSQIRLSLNCGPGPSPGNPTSNGPAINTPETPCTNADPGVFGGLPPSGSGSQACAGNIFLITAPDATGQLDMLPVTPLFLHNGETCQISFTFGVLALPSKDTFPAAPGMQTTSVSAVRSQVVIDPGNPAAVGLQAAGLGSGDAVQVKLPPTCATQPSMCPTKSCANQPSAASCPASAFAGQAANLSLGGKGCGSNRLRARVLGTGVKKVIYLLDGHILRVVTRAPFKLNVKTRMSQGSHNLTASVTFTRASGRAPVVLSKRVSRCGDPNFTG